jgi:uncharacterized protein (DUF362 family)
MRDTRETLNDINAFEYLHSKGNRILIKPNIASPEALYSVSPSVLYVLAKLLVDDGFFGSNWRKSINSHLNQRGLS